MCYRFTAGGVRLAAKVMRSVVSVRPTVCFLSILSLHVMLFKIRTEGNIFVRLFALGWIGLNQLTSVLDFLCVIIKNYFNSTISITSINRKMPQTRATYVKLESSAKQRLQHRSSQRERETDLDREAKRSMCSAM